MNISTRADQAARDKGKSVGDGDLVATDLRSILNLYTDWFDCGRLSFTPTSEQLGTGTKCSPEQDIPNIQRVEDATRWVLVDRLPHDLPVHFALAVIESLAYTTSRFTAADRANRLLYRAEAVRILESGLLGETLSQRMKMSG